MLTDPKLRSQVDALWDKFWTGGLANPLDAIELFSYLLFLKRLDDRENAAERQAKRKGIAYQPKVPKEMRWGYWTKLKAEEALSHLKKLVFPSLVDLADAKSSFGEYMKTAECKINKASLLIEACNLIDQMQIIQQNQDVQGDLYEYLLNKLSAAGRNGQCFSCMLDIARPTFILPKWGYMPRRISEEATCRQTIDPQLEKVGWYLRGKALRELQSQTQEELPLSLRFGGASRDALLPSVLDKLSTLTLYEGFQQGASQR